MKVAIGFRQIDRQPKARRWSSASIVRAGMIRVLIPKSEAVLPEEGFFRLD
jgi:hypothetical protein